MNWAGVGVSLYASPIPLSDVETGHLGGVIGRCLRIARTQGALVPVDDSGALPESFLECGPAKAGGEGRKRYEHPPCIVEGASTPHQFCPESGVSREKP